MSWTWGAVTSFPALPGARGPAVVAGQRELTRRLSRAGAHLVLVESPAAGPSFETAVLPAHLAGPVPGAAVLPGGRVADAPPYLLARQVVASDHLTHGRTGWWCQDAGDDPARAAEYLGVLAALWDSWEPDALVMDRASGAYADHRKVHPVEHRGRHYRVRGPLNTLPSPQGRPVLAVSATGTAAVEVAAGHADLLVVGGPVDDAADAVARLRAGLAAAGRPLDACRALLRRPARTPADELTEAVTRCGADGFLLELPAGDTPALDRDLTAVTADLVPDLTRAGVLAPPAPRATLRTRLQETT